jgi:hypothetical protein
MTTTDLAARGFWRAIRLPKAYTFCVVCLEYRWFSWWQGPRFQMQVAACDACGELAVGEDTYAQTCPVIEQPVLVKK